MENNIQNNEQQEYEFTLTESENDSVTESEHHHSHHHHSSSHKSSRSSESSNKRTHVKNTVSRIRFEGKSKKRSRKNGFWKNIKYKYRKMSSSERKKIKISLCIIGVLIIAAGALLTVKLLHNHEYGDWVVLEESDCYQTGKGMRECKCGDKQYMTIPVSHRYSFLRINTENGLAVSKCEKCGETVERVPTYNELGIPVVSFNGSLSGVSKSSFKDVEISYSSEKLSFEHKALIKLQGATSTGFPKKNYTIKLKTDDGSKAKEEFFDGWGKHSKYCLKANYCDASHLRNVVSAKLYGQVAKTGKRTDYYTGLVNGGAIDGFPVAVYTGGEFHGLYSLNIPKDEWMFNIKDGVGKQAALFCANWTKAAFLEENLGYDVESFGFEYTYCSTEETEWATDSFNEMMNFVINTDGEDFVKGIGEYVNIDVAIDSFITSLLINGEDNFGKNIMWTTFDGKVWTPTVYDLDMTWGLTKYGSEFVEPDHLGPRKRTRKNLLFTKMFTYMYDDVQSRYQELRKTVFSQQNVEKTFNDYKALIPDDIMTLERRKWLNAPSTSTNNTEQIFSFAKEHFAFIDTYFD